jgi:hypothetical protein
MISGWKFLVIIKYWLEEREATDRECAAYATAVVDKLLRDLK